MIRFVTLTFLLLTFTSLVPQQIFARSYFEQRKLAQYTSFGQTNNNTGPCNCSNICQQSQDKAVNCTCGYSALTNQSGIGQDQKLTNCSDCGEALGADKRCCCCCPCCCCCCPCCCCCCKRDEAATVVMMDNTGSAKAEEEEDTEHRSKKKDALKKTKDTDESEEDDDKLHKKMKDSPSAAVGDQCIETYQCPADAICKKKARDDDDNNNTLKTCQCKIGKEKLEPESGKLVCA